MNTISKRLQEAVASKNNISSRRLSELTGIPKSAIQRYISGTTDRIPIDRLKLLATALGVTPGYLMGIETKSGEPVPVVTDENIELVNSLASQLNSDNLQLAVDFLAMLVNKQ